MFANITNQFNQVHYNTPSSVMSSDNFGKYTSASDPRKIEVGGRFHDEPNPNPLNRTY